MVFCRPSRRATPCAARREKNDPEENAQKKFGENFFDEFFTNTPAPSRVSRRFSAAEAAMRLKLRLYDPRMIFTEPGMLCRRKFLSRRCFADEIFQAADGENFTVEKMPSNFRGQKNGRSKLRSVAASAPVFL